MELKNKLIVAARHERAAEHRRAEVSMLEKSSIDPQSPESLKARYLLFLVGFHSVQADLWRKSAREFPE